MFDVYRVKESWCCSKLVCLESGSRILWSSTAILDSCFGIVGPFKWSPIYVCIIFKIDGTEIIHFQMKFNVHYVYEAKFAVFRCNSFHI